MKKSIPVSDCLSEYFSNPCPMLSDSNAQMILDEIAKGHDYIVEYGMGSSTLYFLQALEGKERKESSYRLRTILTGLKYALIK